MTSICDIQVAQYTEKEASFVAISLPPTLLCQRLYIILSLGTCPSVFIYRSWYLVMETRILVRDIFPKVQMSKLRTSAARRGEIARGEVRTEEYCRDSQLNALFCGQFGVGAADMRKLVTIFNLLTSSYYHITIMCHHVLNLMLLSIQHPDQACSCLSYFLCYTFDFTLTILTIPDNTWQ